jgi:hypothetical protein
MVWGRAARQDTYTMIYQMRHGHKTSSKIQDGYKTEIITGGKNGELVVALDTMPANTADGTKMGELLDKADETGYRQGRYLGLHKTK